MAAEQLLGEGQLDDALAELKQQVRADAANPKHRIFLFQLLAVLGDWERAGTQLEVAGDLDPSALAMVQTYREALRCEVLRSQIFAGKRSPLVFGDPERWLALLLEALQLTAAGEDAKAAPLRDDAFAAAPATSGMIDGQPFDWIADADLRLGPVLEAIINGRYYWVPFHRIRTLEVEPPADLRDIVWMPAHFTWVNGGDTVGLIPTRYPGSEASPDASIRLARRTDWLEPLPGMYIGQGQRMLATDSGEYPLMDVRLVELGAAAGKEANDIANSEPDAVSGGG
ncbi:MAG: type VI secretion system accessory protein TagJ [Chromatiaceae bacterium]